MGQRSQIFVRYEKNRRKELVARYYQWNFGERMISRARYSIEWLKETYKYPWEIESKLYRILDTNFDMIDCVISIDLIKEFKEYKELWNGYTLGEYLFLEQTDNDGKLLLDVLPDGNIKYAFLNHNDVFHLSADEYMKWDVGQSWQNPSDFLSKEDIDICKKNIEEINKITMLMTKEEVEEFVSFDYSYLLEDR